MTGNRVGPSGKPARQIAAAGEVGQMAFELDDDIAAALVGGSGSVDTVVTAEDTAVAHGSGDLPVLATPRLVALLEGASVRALAGRLPPGSTSVGTRIDVRHRAPSPIGTAITAHARVVGVNGARVTFDVWATQQAGADLSEIGRGTHTRVVVDPAAFA